MPSVAAQALRLAGVQDKLGHTTYFIGAKGSRVDGRKFYETSNPPSDDHSEGAEAAYYREVMQKAQALGVDVIDNHIDQVRAHWPALYGPIPVVHTVDIAVKPEFLASRDTAQTKQPLAINVNWVSRRQKEISGGKPQDAVVYHGVDSKRYCLGDPKKRTEDLLYVGRIVPEKGVHHAIKVAKELGLSLDIVGPKVDEAYFKTKIDPYLTDKIRYLGPKTPAETVPLYQTHRVFANPIEVDEAFGLTMAEAPLSGCPVVVFNRGSAPELITNGKNGYVVPPGDFDAYKAAIKQAMVLDPAAARQESLRFSSENSAKNFINRYQQVINQHTAEVSTNPDAGELPAKDWTRKFSCKTPQPGFKAK